MPLEFIGNRVIDSKYGEIPNYIHSPKLESLERDKELFFTEAQRMGIITQLQQNSLKQMQNVLKIKKISNSNFDFIDEEDIYRSFLTAMADQINQQVSRNSSIINLVQGPERKNLIYFLANPTNQNFNLQAIFQSIENAFLEAYNLSKNDSNIFRACVCNLKINDNSHFAKIIKELQNTVQDTVLQISEKDLNENLPKVSNFFSTLQKINQYASKSSIEGTLNNTINGLLGENYIKTLLDDMAQKETTKIFGHLKTETSNRARTDVSQNFDGYVITVKRNNYVITGDLNVSSKWSKNVNQKMPISKITGIAHIIDRTPVLKHINTTQMLQDKSRMYINAFFHNDSKIAIAKEAKFQEARQLVLNSITTKALLGNTNKIEGTNINDTVTFLSINGRFYSIYEIILKVLNGIIKPKIDYHPTLTTLKKSNQSILDLKTPRVLAAIKRSEKAFSAFSKFNISVKLAYKDLLK